MRPPFGVDPVVQRPSFALLGSQGSLRRSRPAPPPKALAATGSRLLRGERQIFDAVEAQFAAFKGTERALLFSSGYLANLAVLTTLPEAGDVICSDSLNHASLIDAVRLSRNPGRLSAQRRRCADASTADTPAGAPASSSSNRCSAWMAIARRSRACVELLSQTGAAHRRRSARGRCLWRDGEWTH